MSREDPVSLEELRNISPLAGIGPLHKIDWALGNEQHIFTTIRCEDQFALLERVDNHLLVIEHDQNYTSFIVSALSRKTGGGERGAYSREDAYFKFWPIGEALVRRGG